MKEQSSRSSEYPIMSDFDRRNLVIRAVREAWEREEMRDIDKMLERLERLSNEEM